MVDDAISDSGFGSVAESLMWGDGACLS